MQVINADFGKSLGKIKPMHSVNNGPVYKFSADQHITNIDSSRELNIPLELNFLGIRGKRNYSDERFWRLAGQEKSPVVFGLDAHSPSASYDEASLKTAMELADKYSLNIVKPKIKAI